MAKYTGPVLKKCRTFDLDPSVVGLDKKSKKNPKRNQKKLSEYGLQLREKQKVKFVYGMQERQFRNLFERATRMQGPTGENLLKLLELRFDNVVYRMGFAKTRAQARQMVVHGHFLVNGKKVNIPSYTMSAGDVVTVRSKSKQNAFFKERQEVTHGLMPWLEVDMDNLQGKILSEPMRDNIDFTVTETQIVELYSK